MLSEDDDLETQMQDASLTSGTVPSMDAILGLTGKSGLGSNDKSLARDVSVRMLAHTCVRALVRLRACLLPWH